MIELHPKILSKNGRPEFAVIPYDEYLEVRRLLDDAQDLIDLREAKASERDASTLSLAEAKRELEL